MKKFIWVLGFLFLSIHSPASKADSYSAMMETLVYLGITDKETVNHNITVYQSILKSSHWHLTCSVQACGKRTPEHRKYFVFKNIQELHGRINKQMFYLSSDMIDILSPEINQTLNEAKTALHKNDFKKAIELNKKAFLELQGARL